MEHCTTGTNYGEATEGGDASSLNYSQRRTNTRKRGRVDNGSSNDYIHSNSSRRNDIDDTARGSVDSLVFTQKQNRNNLTNGLGPWGDSNNNNSTKCNGHNNNNNIKIINNSTVITMITINKTQMVSPPHNSINNPSQKYLTMANSKPQPNNIMLRTLIIVLIVIRQQHHRPLNGLRRRIQYPFLLPRQTVGAIMMLVLLNPVETYRWGWIIMHPLPSFKWMLQHYNPSLNYYAEIISSMLISNYHLKGYIH